MEISLEISQTKFAKIGIQFFATKKHVLSINSRMTSLLPQFIGATVGRTPPSQNSWCQPPPDAEWRNGVGIPARSSLDGKSLGLMMINRD